MHHKFIKNTMWLMSGKIIQMMISFVVGIITMRYLGPSNYGLLSYAGTYIAFFSSICTLGLNSVIIRYFVLMPEKEDEIVGSAILMKLIASAVSVIVLFFIIGITEKFDQVLMTIAALQSLQLIFNSFDIINYWHQSKLNSKNVVICQTIAYVLLSIYKILILMNHCSVEWFAFSNSLDSILVAVLLLIGFKYKNKRKIAFSKRTCFILLKDGKHFLLVGVLSNLLGNIDKVMIRGMGGDIAQVGLYTAALTISGYVSFIPQALVDSARPLLVEMRESSYQSYERRLTQLYMCIIWMSILYATAVNIFAKPIVLLLYGNEYLPMVTSLRLVIWYTCFSYLGSARSIWILCEKKNKYLTIFTLWGCGLDIVLNFLFIHLWGIEGAALSTLITQVLIQIIIPTMYKQTRRNTRYIMDALLLKNIKFKKGKIDFEIH